MTSNQIGLDLATFGAVLECHRYRSSDRLLPDDG
jgi:hypothetical protein